MFIINATDLGVDMDDFEAPGDLTGWVFLYGLNPWSMFEHAEARLGLAPCPVCDGGSPRRRCYCLGCDRTGLDGKVAFPGLEVDEASDPDWSGADWTELERQRVA